MQLNWVSFQLLVCYGEQAAGQWPRHAAVVYLDLPDGALNGTALIAEGTVVTMCTIRYTIQEFGISHTDCVYVVR